MGNLTFNPKNWPEPKAMVDTLKSYGTKIMVSTWPFSQGQSKTFKPLQEQGWWKNSPVCPLARPN